MTLEALESDAKTKAARIISELKYRREINPLKYHASMPMQQRFSDDPAKFKCIFGANRSGKSEEAIKYVIKKMLGKPRQKWWICGETFQDSISIQQTKAWKLVPKHRIRYGKFDVINGFTNRKLLLDNGSLAIFKSYDQKRESFQGDDVDGILDDEEPPFEIFQEQKMRLIDRDGEMIISMTSLKGITDLIETIFDGHDVIESQHAPLIGRVLPRVAQKNGVKFYFLWSEENKHINQNRLIAESKLMTQDEILCRMYGVPVNLAGKIYMSFSRDPHVISLDDVPEQGNQLWNILDPHDRKPWAITWELVNKNGSCYQVDEYPNRNFIEMSFDDKTYEEYAEIIRIKEQAIRERFKISGNTKRIIDPNFGNKTVQLAKRQGGQSKTTPKEEMARLGFKYNDGIDALEAGHLEVRKWLHWVKRDGQLVVAPLLYICDNCTNTISHMSRYSRKDTSGADGDIKDTVGPMDKYKDFCDNKRYFVMANPKWIEAKTFSLPKTRTY